jgi:hypothetical protein
VPLVLAACLAAACESTSESPQPAPQTKAKAESVPALPIIPQKEAAPAAQADAPAAAQPQSRADRLAALTKEESDAMDAYYKALQAAMGDNKNPTTEEWKKIQEQVKEPDTKGYAERAQQLLDEDATDLTAFNTIRWMMDNVREPATTGSMIALLEKHHMDRPEMADLCDRLAGGEGSRLLPKLMAGSPHTDVRGRACFATAEGLKSDIERKQNMEGKSPEELANWAKYLGADKIASLETLDVDATQKQMEELYERTEREFGAVKLYVGTKRETTLGKRAGAALYEIRHLAVGMPSPEIEGSDLDSVAFKLSDYKGKVVLLDFWGNW